MKSRPSSKNHHGANGASAGPKGNGGNESKSVSERRSLKRLSPLLVLAVGYVALLALTLPHPKRGTPEFSIGRPSPEKIVASRDIEIPDHGQTHDLRREAAEKVIPVFREDPAALQEARARVDHFFKAAQAVSQNPEIPAEQRPQRLAEATQLTPQRDAETLELLLSYPNYGLLQETLKTVLGQVLQNGVVPSAEDWAAVQRHLQEGIDVIDEQGKVARRIKVESILDLNGARQELRRLIAEKFNKPLEDERPRQLAGNLGDLALTANLVPYKKLWQEREQDAKNAVPAVMVRIQKDQKLLDEGDIIPEKLSISLPDGGQVSVDSEWVLEEILGQGDSTAWSQLAARSLLVLVPLLLWGVYVRRYHHAIWRDLTRLSCLVGLMLLVVGIGQLLLYLSVALEGNLEHIGYTMPVALAGLLVTILLNPQLALFTVLMLALYSGFLFGEVDFVVVNLTAGLVAIFSTSAVRRRIDITWAGTKVALAATVVASLLYLGRLESLSEIQSDTHPWMLIVIWSVFHGVLTIMLAGLLLPLLEYLMGIVTDFQLLELSQKTSLLKQLELEAPGTYQHSVNVATLAESAAEAIGANGLLARVASLYHDIGKLNKPTYFSENQIRDADKKTHAKLTPSMSRLLICNHIKDGQEMAEQHNLPAFIRNAIAQHHGTTLLTYFYDKALQEDSKDVVHESDYRYPGPRPQTVEMAILMLADSLEAASRSLPVGITHGELYQFVRKIINQKFMDDQFDECDLTLSDLHGLAEAFTRSLVSLLHRRVAYPSVPVDSEKQEKQAFSRPKATGQDIEEARTPVGVGSGEETARAHTPKGASGG